MDGWLDGMAWIGWCTMAHFKSGFYIGNRFYSFRKFTNCSRVQFYENDVIGLLPSDKMFAYIFGAFEMYEIAFRLPNGTEFIFEF